MKKHARVSITLTAQQWADLSLVLHEAYNCAPLFQGILPQERRRYYSRLAMIHLKDQLKAAKVARGIE